jgi:RNA polymerase sigma-70 factor (ECF subfamily)
MQCEILLRCDGELPSLLGVVPLLCPSPPSSVRKRKMNSQSPTLRKALLTQIPTMRGFALSLCGDPEHADDLVQETLVKAWRHLESFQEGTNLRAWLFTILRNTFFSECRLRRREVEVQDGRTIDTLYVQPAQEGHVDLQDFRKALYRLPEKQREALVLVGAAGFSYDEAASIAGCAVGTIKSRVNRARCGLVELLGAGPQTFGPDPITEAIVTGRVAPHMYGD